MSTGPSDRRKRDRTPNPDRGSSDLQGRKPHQRQDHRYDPESNDDGWFGPAFLLEMVVERRHEEDAGAGALVPEHLHDHRYSFDDEQAADNAQHDLVLGRDGYGTQCAADREAADIAHEYRRRRRVEP